ncbi:hypothetical protein ACS0TY_017748 [Phlomoides rotata]
MGAEAAEWGTWEELILGGAVLRHGTGDWNVVASEIRTRTLYPTAFTPQACKERFQDLQKRYCGSTTWFDELRKRRMAELKQELAKSENSIGSLESKIKYLEVEKQHSNQADYGLSETESRLPALDSEATESISRQTSNDANSVGSFTKKTGTSHRAVEADTKPSSSACFEQDKETFPEMGYGHWVVFRKKRSQRKRKECFKERSVGESDNLGSSNIVSTAPKETSTNDNEITRTSGTINHSYAMRKDSLIEIFKSVAESEPASVFKHRMDSQKRARYRRVIKQHMDIGTIRSRIMGQCIKSAKELFRDLLLVANNALVFYSRRTREYKSAASLRLLVMKEYKLFVCRGMGYSNEATSAFIPCNPPVKRRTARPRPVPCKEKLAERPCDVVAESRICKIDNINDVSKGLKRAGKVKSGGLVDPPRKTTAVKQRKRLRR